MTCQNQALNLFQNKTNLLLFICVLFYWSIVCISAYANVYLKTTITKQNTNITLIAGVPSSQALPVFLITAPPSVCVPDLIGALAVWIQKKKFFHSCVEDVWWGGAAWAGAPKTVRLVFKVAWNGNKEFVLRTIKFLITVFFFSLLTVRDPKWTL